MKLQIKIFKYLFKTRRNPESFSSFKTLPLSYKACIQIFLHPINNHWIGPSFCPWFFLLSLSFLSEVHHTINVNICRYVRFNGDFKLEHEKKIIVEKSYIIKNVFRPLILKECWLGASTSSMKTQFTRIIKNHSVHELTAFIGTAWHNSFLCKGWWSWVLIKRLEWIVWTEVNTSGTLLPCLLLEDYVSIMAGVSALWKQ